MCGNYVDLLRVQVGCLVQVGKIFFFFPPASQPDVQQGSLALPTNIRHQDVCGKRLAFKSACHSYPPVCLPPACLDDGDILPGSDKMQLLHLSGLRLPFEFTKSFYSLAHWDPK